ncbi:MAG: electron transfer flavoprotein subunit beta [Bacteroidia bacterium]|nr:electron transfer flavoprotein subunit beta [Bacteroidia bacterium]
MNILVFLKQVPDLVEELEVDASGTNLDRSWIRYIPSEQDEHAVEQAILLKEAYGGSVTVAALEIGDIDDALFTSFAKGADSLIRISLENAQELRSHEAAEIYAKLFRDGEYDLILTGVQAIDDLDGPVGARLATILDIPYIGVVRGIELEPESHSVRVKKEFPGGVVAVLRSPLPIVVGIQSSESPPRYVPIARIRQAAKSASINNLSFATGSAKNQFLVIERLYKPEQTGGAEMIEGTPEEIADRLITLFSENGLVR